MNNIEQILEIEKWNDGQIHLYKIDRYWLAFERSAFNLFSVCNVDTVVKVRSIREGKNSMLIAIVKESAPVLYNPQFTILEESEDEVLMRSRIICRGFQHWKNSMISLTSDKLYTVARDTAYNVQHLNINMLLN